MLGGCWVMLVPLVSSVLHIGPGLSSLKPRHIVAFFCLLIPGFILSLPIIVVYLGARKVLDTIFPKREHTHFGSNLAGKIIARLFR